MRIAAAVLRASLVIGAFTLPVVAQTLLVPAAASAPAPSHEVVVRPVGGFVMTGITLSAQQQTRVRAINARYAAERDSIVGDDEQPAADSATRARLVENIDRMMAEERLVLTPAQRARFDRNVATVQARRRELTRHP